MSNELITEEIRRMPGAMAVKFAGKFRRKYGSDVVEEMEAIGLLALVNAARHYNPTRADAASFTTYAYNSIRNKFLYELGLSKGASRANLPRWHGGGNVSLEDEAGDATLGDLLLVCEDDPSLSAETDDEFEVARRIMAGTLTDAEADAYTLHHVDGLSGADIGRMRGCTTSNATELIRKATQKIRQALRHPNTQEPVPQRPGRPAGGGMRITGPSKSGCRRCGAELPPSKHPRVYCSDRCKNLWLRWLSNNRKRQRCWEEAHASHP